MPEGTSEGTTGAGTGQAPAWVSQLPADLKDNAVFTSYKTIGDLAKDDLAMREKLKEFDGMKARLDDSVPKLPDDATDEERGIYYNALGRPETAKDYEFDGEDKNAPEWTNKWKQRLHSLGLTKAQAKQLSAEWNSDMQEMVNAHNAKVEADKVSLKNEITQAETKFRSELGDKFDTNVELAKRMWVKYGEGDFDKAFDRETSATRVPIMRMIIKFAALTGEDRSPLAGTSASAMSKGNFVTYDKSPAPPKK
jgi:hypothetical protein